MKLFFLALQLRCNQSVKSDKHANSHKVGGKSLESLFDLHQGWNFLGEKFLTIVMSLNDIDRGMSVESFPSIY